MNNFPSDFPEIRRLALLTVIDQIFFFQLTFYILRLRIAYIVTYNEEINICYWTCLRRKGDIYNFVRRCFADLKISAWKDFLCGFCLSVPLHFLIHLDRKSKLLTHLLSRQMKAAGTLVGVFEIHCYMGLCRKEAYKHHRN